MSAISKEDVRQILEVAVSKKIIKKVLGWNKNKQASGSEKINVDFYFRQFGSICSIRLDQPVEENSEGKYLVPESSLETSYVRRQFIDIFTDKLYAEIKMNDNLVNDFAAALYKVIRESDNEKLRFSSRAICRQRVTKKVGEIIAKNGKQEQIASWLEGVNGFNIFYQEMMFSYFESLGAGSIAPNFVIESAKKFMKEGWWMSPGGEDALINTLVKLNLENEKDFLDLIEAEIKNPRQYIKFEHVEKIKAKLSEYARKCDYGGEAGMMGGSIGDGQLFVHRGVFRRSFFFEKFGQDKVGAAKAAHMIEFIPNMLAATKSILDVGKKDEKWLSGSGLLTYKAMHSGAFCTNDFSKMHDNEFVLVATSQKQLNEAKEVLRLVELNCDALADHLVKELSGVKGLSKRDARMRIISDGLIDLLKVFEMKKNIMNIGPEKDGDKISTPKTRSGSLKM